MKAIYQWALALSLVATPYLSQAQSSTYKGSTYYHQRESLFRSLPVSPGATIFLGNSITDGGEWSELLGQYNILNRGISGDVTKGVLSRLDEIVRHEPNKVFLLIGINDLAQGRAADLICRDIFLIVREIRQHSPKTKVYVQSLLPVSDHYTKFKTAVDKGEHIILINRVLKNNASKHHYTFIDLHTQMADGSGRLRDEFTNDGLHLMGAAYVHWANIIKKYLE